MTGISKYIECNDREIHFMEWGDTGKPALIMWHGLARTSRDFDDLARALAGGYRIICPDTLGRGLSQWAQDADQEYRYENYVALAVALLDGLAIDHCSWVGTSMGGAIGIAAAGGALRGRIERLVLNDIGPWVSDEGADRIAAYVGAPPVFDHLTELEGWLRSVYTPFGAQSDDFWCRMCESSYRRNDEGHITVHYDPRIAYQLTRHRGDLDQWAAYDRITCPTLLLRGEHSDILSADTALEMVKRGPRPRLEMIPGIGHCSTLRQDRDIALVRDFLAEV